VSERPKVYLAGPDVFLPHSAEIGRHKQERCAAHGLEGLYPGEGVDLRALPVDEHARALFDGCVAMMDRCVAGLANLTPFRGASADVGTAFEMGYLFGRGFPVFGYTAHVDDYAARVDDEDLMVEAFGLADNLMLEGPMMRHGRAVVRVADEGEWPIAALGAFEVAVQLAARELGTR
jgi:nucleoside 2-deoxyribosyltransferase